MKDDCAICERLNLARENLYGIAKFILISTPGKSKREKQDFGLHISVMENADKVIVKLIHQHEEFHRFEDSSTLARSSIDQKFNFFLEKTKVEPKKKEAKKIKKKKDKEDE